LVLKAQIRGYDIDRVFMEKFSRVSLSEMVMLREELPEKIDDPVPELDMMLI
jgi:hypothetical protein